MDCNKIAIKKDSWISRIKGKILKAYFFEEIKQFALPAEMHKNRRKKNI